MSRNSLFEQYVKIQTKPCKINADYGLTGDSIAGNPGMTAILQIVIGPFCRRPVMLAGGTGGPVVGSTRHRQPNFGQSLTAICGFHS